MEQCDEEEMAEFLEELNSPLDIAPKQAQANLQRWLREAD